VFDAARDPDAVHADIARAVAEFLDRRGAPRGV